MPDSNTHLLVDGRLPMTADALLERLAGRGLSVTTVRHDPVFTVEEAKRVRGSLPGCHTKNLFLRNKKKRMWLLVCEQDREVDLLALGKHLGAGRLSFGSPTRLMQYLGVIPGAVNPFAVVNDGGGAVTVVLDRAILDQDPLNFHPLDNGMTTSIAPADFLRFLEMEGHSPALVELPLPPA